MSLLSKSPPHLPYSVLEPFIGDGTDICIRYRAIDLAGGSLTSDDWYGIASKVALLIQAPIKPNTLVSGVTFKTSWFVRVRQGVQVGQLVPLDALRPIKESFQAKYDVHVPKPVYIVHEDRLELLRGNVRVEIDTTGEIEKAILNLKEYL